MVRSVLGRYLQKDPQKIQFVRNVNGKPELSPEGPIPDIRFSISRTNEKVCLGDHQKIRDRPGSCKKRRPGILFQRLHTTFSHRANRQWIAQAVPGLRPLRFFRIWALKEALLKATGSSARMMQEGNVAGIMTDTYLNGWYPVFIGKREMLFFIHESGCGTGHHRVIAAHR